MDDAELLAVLVEPVDAGDLDPAGGRAGQVAFRAGSAAVRDPDMQFDRVATQVPSFFPSWLNSVKPRALSRNAIALRSSETGSAGTAARNRAVVVVVVLVTHDPRRS